MIIQNTSNINQASPPVRNISDDAPKVVADTSNAVITTTGVTAHTQQITTQQVALQQPSSEQLKTAVNVINQVMRQSNNSLEFSVDTDTNRTVVKMKDTETGELIRQFPSEETLAISRAIDQFQQGLLLKQKA